MKTFGNRGTGVRGTGVAKLASGIPLVLLALAAAVVTIAGLSVVRHDCMALSTPWNPLQAKPCQHSYMRVCRSVARILAALSIAPQRVNKPRSVDTVALRKARTWISPLSP